MSDDMTCAVETCHRDSYVRGFCAAHYQRLLTMGDVRADIAIGGFWTVTSDDVLEAIKQTVRERGYPPTVREIGDIVGLSSPSSVHHHLQVLEDEGKISRVPGSPRALRLLEES